MNEEIKKKIEEWADSKDRVLTSYNKGLKEGAEYGYGLAQEEIARLTAQNEKMNKQIKEVLDYLSLRESVEPEKIEVAERTIIEEIDSILNDK